MRPEVGSEFAIFLLPRTLFQRIHEAG
jgi:hypothetical protein